jgi:hypothetical protein
MSAANKPRVHIVCVLISMLEKRAFVGLVVEKSRFVGAAPDAECSLPGGAELSCGTGFARDLLSDVGEWYRATDPPQCGMNARWVGRCN